ncbi:hypothetical protein L2E82_47723 [Cichorium intybus]|uniref:Uncharacterized protein n=1 Tax=Cichorium intybus TaxID=13427 RepID=A0ACB8YXC3_CICIN|nr:hypothetical protein L2E82_47723 [Cichorium intybus]
MHQLLHLVVHHLPNLARVIGSNPVVGKADCRLNNPLANFFQPMSPKRVFSGEVTTYPKEKGGWDQYRAYYDKHWDIDDKHKRWSESFSAMEVYNEGVGCLWFLKGGRWVYIVVGGGLVGHTFAYAGHNVVLEIQATIPSTPEKPSKGPMWKGVVVAYIAICYFPVAIIEYWVFGNQVSDNILISLEKSTWLIAMANLFVVIHVIGSYLDFIHPG